MSKRLARLTRPLVNRIVGHGEEAVDQLLANPLNYRLHPDNQQHALAGAIDDIGFIRSVTVNRRTGRVVDGHLRVTLAARSGVATLPVEYVDLSEAEEAQALLSLDPIAAMAASDKAKLDELMRAVQSDDERVQTMLAEMAEREGLDYGKAEPPAEDPGAQVSKAEELRQKWGVESGQLWQLGEHRLICGDCTDAGVVDRLMAGEKAECMWTDPPYGVDYVGGTKDALTIQNDGKEELPGLLLAAFTVAEKVLIGGAPFYVAHPAGALQLVFLKTITDIGWHIHQQLVWVKDSMVLGHSDYHYKHEPILYGWTPGEGRPGRGKHEGSRWYGDNSQVSVFEIPRPKRSAEHPTMKPPELVEAHLQNSTRSGDAVYEPFLGSGTTMIACERLGRKCRAVEISPAYVAVALDRWATMTGQMPILLESGG